MATNKEFLIQHRRLISLRLELDRYESVTINQMLSVYDQSIKNIEKRLKKTKGVATKKQQTKLLKQMKEAYSALGELIKPNIFSNVKKVAEQAFEGIDNILSWDGKDKDFNHPIERADSLIKAVDTVPIGGKILSDWVDTVFDNTLDLQRNILASSLAGESYQGIYRNLKNVFGDFTRKELITLARTYNQSVVVETQNTFFEENKDIVKKVEWTAVMEIGFSASGRGTCPRCAALDGETYPLDGDKPPMPLHARCRCMWSPVTITWNELFKKHRLVDENGELLSIDEMEKDYRPFLNRKEANIDLGRRAGNIIDAEWTGKNYGDFITEKGGASLESVVGPNRAKLIENGLIDFSDIVDRRTGELFTLKELGYPIVSKNKFIPTKKLKISLDGVKFNSGKFSKTDYEKVLSTLPKNLQQVISKYPNPKKIEYNPNVTSHYIGEEKYLNVNPVDRGGAVLFHEYAHHLDSEYGNKFNSRFASENISNFKKALTKDGINLGVILDRSNFSMATQKERRLRRKKIKEFEESSKKILEDIKNKHYQEVINTTKELKTFKLKNSKLGNYFDIIDAMTEGDYHQIYGVHGHGVRYYLKPGMKEVETFANLFALKAEKETWNLVKKDFPELAKSFDQIIKDMLK